MTTFDDFWDTTGPWPDNILTSAFKELAEKAWRAGKASTGLSAGVAVAFQDVISGFHGHPGKPCWLGCCETKLPLRPEIPEPQEGWTEHRARGCTKFHLDATCPEGYGPKEHCALRVAGVPCAIHDRPDPHAACLDPGCGQHGQDTRPAPMSVSQGTVAGYCTCPGREYEPMCPVHGV